MDMIAGIEGKASNFYGSPMKNLKILGSSRN